MSRNTCIYLLREMYFSFKTILDISVFLNPMFHIYHICMFHTYYMQKPFQTNHKADLP